MAFTRKLISDSIAMRAVSCQGIIQLLISTTRCLFLCVVVPIQASGQDSALVIPTFSHEAIDTVFRSESVTSADINLDGKVDVVIGDLWYQAPQWDAREIRSPGTYLSSIHRDDRPTDKFNYYSDAFAVQAIDANRDQYPDILIYPVMNQPIRCYLNPMSVNQHWEVTEIVKRYHGESPLLVDLWQDGTYGALAGVHQEDSLFHLSWMYPADDGSWKSISVGHTAQIRYRGPGWDQLTKWYAAGSRDHGLGIGDIDGDGKQDIVTRQGWYQSPPEPYRSNWQFHSMRFDSIVSPEYPHYQFAQMPVFDIDQDGDTDIFCSSAHRHGLWWFEQIQQNGEITFIKHDIPFHISQVHAVAMADLNKNGVPDIVLGKRYLAHNGGDPGWDEPLHLLWLEPRTGDSGTEFQISVIHTGVGVGTQIAISDMNADGWDDILVSNKKGTHIFWQDVPRHHRSTNDE